MSEYTPEPWIDADTEDCTHMVISLYGVSGVPDDHRATRLIGEADYCRALACVNALAGIPTERLPEAAKFTHGACSLCWTSSWAPCEPGTPESVRDPNSNTGGAMICQMCQADRWLAALRASHAMLLAAAVVALPEIRCLYQQVTGHSIDLAKEGRVRRAVDALAAAIAAANLAENLAAGVAGPKGVTP